MARRSGYTSQQPRVTGPGDVDRLRREVDLGLGSVALAVAQLTAATAAADAGVGGDVAALADAPVVLTSADADFPNHRILAVGSPITLAVGAPLGNALIDFDETVALGNNARVTLRKNSGANVGTRRRVNLIEGANIALTLADDAGDEEVDVTVATTGVAGVDAAYVTIGNDGSLTAERALTGSTSILITDNGANSSVVLSVIESALLPDGAEALATAAPITLTISGALAAGTANSFARSDHHHSVSMNTNRMLGRLTAAFGLVEELTAAQVGGWLVGGVVDHGGLGGLGDDDHTQYLLASGTRALTGAWDSGAPDVTHGGNFTLDGASPVTTVGDGTGTPNEHYNKGAAGEYYGELLSGGTREWLFPYFTSSESLGLERWTGGVGINTMLTFAPSATQAAAATTLSDGAVLLSYTSVALTLGAGSGSPSETIDADGTGTGTLSFLKDSAVTSGKRLTHDTGEDLSIESHNGSAWLQVAEIDDADHTWQFHRQWNTPWTTYAPGGTTQTIDWNDGNLVVLDIGDASGDVTLTLDNPNDGAIYHILVTQDQNDTRDVVWPANVTWPGGTAPVITISGDDVPYDLVKLVYHTSLDLYFATFDQHFV